MALSKLAILLIAGIGSVAAVGGITAGIVVSNNRNTERGIEEEKAESKEDKKPSISESRNKTDVQNDQQTNSSTNKEVRDKNVEETSLNKEKGVVNSDSQSQGSDVDMNMGVSSTPTNQATVESGNDSQRAEVNKTEDVPSQGKEKPKDDQPQKVDKDEDEALDGVSKESETQAKSRTSGSDSAEVTSKDLLETMKQQQGDNHPN